MGLDMYLYQSPKFADPEKIIDYENNIDAIIEHHGKTYEKIKPYIIKRGDPKFFQWDAILKDVAYWRKANAIHMWFVDNVQDGIDECETHVVTPDQLQELLDTCHQVIDNPDCAEKLLPPSSGFFFGSTEIDEWYFKSVQDTIHQVETALLNYNPEENYFFYRSSW